MALVFFDSQLTHKSVGSTQQARVYREKRVCREIRMCLGEAPMTLQERQGILWKLTARKL